MLSARRRPLVDALQALLLPEVGPTSAVTELFLALLDDLDESFRHWARIGLQELAPVSKDVRRARFERGIERTVRH
jgi:hypothetical protein